MDSLLPIAAGHLAPPLPPFYDPGLLARFLSGAQGDADKAAKALAEDARWRAAQGLGFGELETPFTRTLTADSWQAWMQAYWPFGWHGRTPAGEPICCLRIGAVDLRGLLRRVPRAALLRFHVARCLETEEVTRAAGVSACVMLYDLEGTSLGHLLPDSLAFFRELSAISAAHFPEQYSRLVGVRASAPIRLAWGVLSGCIARGMARRVQLLAPENHSELAEIFGGEGRTPAFLGGGCRCGPGGDCMGGGRAGPL